ncbi:CDK-activating kinase assembly factor MAT1 [Bienertia sinuspersici]
MVVPSSGSAFAKEVAIRKRIISIFNKREEDFSSLKEYNDYLEEVEDMTCNLIEGIDVPAIEDKIARYEKENAEQIMNARARKACKRLCITAEELAAALAASKGPAQGDAEVATEQSSQTGTTTTQGQYAPAVAGAAFMQPRPTGMAPQPLPLGGPDMNLDDEEMMKLRAEKGARAGGWTPELCKKRALEEAFGALWV